MARSRTRLQFLRLLCFKKKLDLSNNARENGMVACRSRRRRTDIVRHNIDCDEEEASGGAAVHLRSLDAITEPDSDWDTLDADADDEPDKHAD